MNFCSFDIEIAKEIPEGETDWDSLRPLGISCAATLQSERTQIRAWFGGDDEPMVFDRESQGRRRYGPQMAQRQCCNLARYLYSNMKMGYLPLTWNGLSFDFRTLAEESGERQRCIELALNHAGMMFQLVCLLGYPVGLDSCLKAMGFAGKHGMRGAGAPRLWKSDPEKVLLYVLAFGLEIRFYNRPHRLDRSFVPGRQLTIVAGCVDNAEARRVIAKECRLLGGGLWWLDCGNHDHSGQVLLGNRDIPAPHINPLGFCDALPVPSLQHPELLRDEPVPVMRCAEAAAAGVQSLMANQAAAGWAASYLYRMIVTQDLDSYATYFDLASGSARSLAITGDVYGDSQLRLVRPTDRPAAGWSVRQGNESLVPPAVHQPDERAADRDQRVPD